MAVQLFGVSRRMYRTDGKEMAFVSGNGCFVTDDAGKQYIDFILGYGPVILGHGNKRFCRRLAAGMEKGFCFPSYGKDQILLAEKIREAYGKDFLVAQHQNGSASIEAAIRICCYMTGKNKIIRYGYTGWHDGQIHDSLNWHEPLNSNKFTKTAVCLDYYGHGRSLNWHDGQLESFIKLCADQDISCFIFDAYQAERRENAILEVIRYCRSSGILVILDETKTSGRISPFGAVSNRYDHDFSIVGKAIGNGIPVSLLLASDAHKGVPYDSLKVSGTYARDNLGASAVLISRKIMEENQYYAETASAGTLIAQEMNRCIEAVYATDHIRVHALLGGSILEFGYSEELANHFAARKEFEHCLAEHRILIPDGHCFYISPLHMVLVQQIKELFYDALCSWVKGVEKTYA